MIEEILKTKVENRPNTKISDDHSKIEFHSSCSRQKNSNDFSETDLISEQTAIPSEEANDWNWKQQSSTFGKEAVAKLGPIAFFSHFKWTLRIKGAV